MLQEINRLIPICSSTDFELKGTIWRWGPIVLQTEWLFSRCSERCSADCNVAYLHEYNTSYYNIILNNPRHVWCIIDAEWGFDEQMKTFSPQVHAYEENVSWPSQVACSPRLTFHNIFTSVISRCPHDQLFCSHRLYASGQCCFLKASWVPREPSWTLDNPTQYVSYQRQPTAPSSSSEASMLLSPTQTLLDAALSLLKGPRVFLIMFQIATIWAGVSSYKNISTNPSPADVLHPGLMNNQ